MFRLTAFCIGLAIAAAVVALIERPAATNIVVMVPPVIVQALPPPPPPRVPAPPAPDPDPRACPAPSTEPRGAPHEPAIDDMLEHVHPSRTDAAWIAAWSDDHIYASHDGGATFVRVLDGPGKVEDVGFDCFGHVIAARDASVGITAGGEHWRGVPGGDSIARVIDGGPDVVLAVVPAGLQHSTRLAASFDRGDTWRFRDLDHAYETAHAQGRQSADGTIRMGVAVADCDYEGMVWLAWRTDGRAETRRTDLVEGDAFGLYGDVAIDGGRVSRNGRAWQPIRGLAYDRVIPIEAPWPAVVQGTSAYRIESDRAKRLPWCVDGGSPAIDLAGRVWMLEGGALAIAHRGACDPETRGH
jgi:hypothetical protein